ncbi:hypothetical protein MMC25_003621 [Agyrium rufum]|nr:hypothetical protein [Agyrium rufum]
MDTPTTTLPTETPEPNEQRLAPGTQATYSKQVSWYSPGPPRLPENVRDLLMNRSEIDLENGGVERHVEKLLVPRNAVGGYRFTGLGLVAHPSFDALVSDLSRSVPLKSENGLPNHLFVDIGCCVGQDIRSLVYAAGSRIVGVGLDPAFVDLGYDLFRDREKLRAKFIAGDLLTLGHSIAPLPRSNQSFVALPDLVGNASVVWAAAFLRLWDLAGQKAVCQRILLLLQDRAGAKVLGRQVGSREAGQVVHVTNKSGLMYKHNPESFREMWDAVLTQTGHLKEDVLASEENQQRWTVKAWFEEDLAAAAQKHQEADQQTDSDWLSRVATESAKVPNDTENTVGSSGPNVDARFLVWEVERIS